MVIKSINDLIGTLNDEDKNYIIREMYKINKANQKIQNKLEYQNKLLNNTNITDNLTGILNSKGLIYRLEGIASEVVRNNRNNKKNDKLYVGVFDLNFLKYINDNYGHLAGDNFIKKFADSLKFRGYDIVARTGGDEFVVIIKNHPTDTDIKNRFSKLSKHLEDRVSFAYGFKEIGDLEKVNSLQEFMKSYELAYKKADRNMYNKKSFMKSKHIDKKYIDKLASNYI